MAKTIISKDTISALSPCLCRFDNYVTHYKGRKLTVAQFFRLKKIKHSDKLWVAFRMMPKEKVGKAAGEIAKSVLDIYEAAYPNDNRPRLAVEAAMRGDNNATSAASAASAAAYVTSAATSAASDRKVQEALQLKIILKYWK